ncbi:MAG TPA: hypothetical protein VIV66_19215 [Pyrinomonadaceae bacterium]
MSNHADQERRLSRGAWLVVFILGFVQAWATRYQIEADGISYLDIADKYLQRDWAAAVNAYWSPLYSWLLAAGMFAFRPSSYWEYPLVHLINFLVYLVAFGCFEFLLFQIIRYQQAGTDYRGDGSFLPTWAWQSIGYVLFLWSSLFLITISVVTPDMVVAAFVFLLAGIMIWIRLHPERWTGFVCFGLALGVAYLAKSVMFPLAFVFLTVCLLSLGKLRRNWPRLLMSCLLFLLVCAPFILALHRAKNRWTFGDSGRLNYVWAVDGTEPIHWQGQPPGTGVPSHPTRKVFESPAVYEFKEPFKVTYPPWYDPSYWYEGAVSRSSPVGHLISPGGHLISSGGHLEVAGNVMLHFYAVFINTPIGMAILFTFLVLTLYSRPKVRQWIAGITLWNILLPAIAALTLYSLVLVETRYIGGFVVLLWLGLFSSVRLGNDDGSRKLRSAVIIALVASSMIVIIAKSMAPAYATLRDVVRKNDILPSPHWAVADGLSKMGLQAGDPIGSIGYSFGGIENSARLTRLRIVAEITVGPYFNPTGDVDKFWHSDPEVQRRVIEVFAKTGAKAIVANQLPPGLSDPPGWKRVGETDAYVYFLR